MKLRARYGGQKSLVEIDDESATVENLKRQLNTLFNICAASDYSTIHLSLNGSDVLKVENTDSLTSLKDLGLVSGDAIYVIVTQQPSCGSGGGGGSNDTGKSFDNDVEMRETAENKSDQLFSLMFQPDNTTTTTSHQHPQQQPQLQQQQQPKQQQQHQQNINKTPLLLRESTENNLPMSLLNVWQQQQQQLQQQQQQLSSSSSGTTTSTVRSISILLHVLLTEKGFEKIETQADDDDIIEIVYRYRNVQESTFHLVVLSVVSNIMVYWIQNMYKVRNFCHLSDSFYQSIIHPALQHMLKGRTCIRSWSLRGSKPDHNGQLRHTYRLGYQLFREDDSKLLRMLDLRSLLHLSQVNKQWYDDVNNNNELWWGLFSRHFGGLEEDDADIIRALDWREQFKQAFIQRKEEERVRKERENLRKIKEFIPRNPLPFPFPLERPGHYHGFPGIIGGAYDMQPDFASVPPSGFPIRYGYSSSHFAPPQPQQPQGRHDADADDGFNGGFAPRFLGDRRFFESRGGRGGGSFFGGFGGPRYY
ncbi:hypothetical protein HELRODRAFT_188141 [Helobdella robusta]|uniref:Ubiquitin-like domain-containing protein n=1 Tax=Helobdella robusta TaxID=6412 RepID=T1FPP5_HELRO|nr:hypothetical protein HELRODRAFT_188141 [Helobdella robusta]ESO13171.1 hypothetical protein HELRODRAFT_188141 [Helobdella robusta]